MSIQKKIIFLGGDARQIIAAAKLSAEGYTVLTLYGDESAKNIFASSETVESALNSSDVIVLPLPVSADGNSLNAPFLQNDKISLSTIAELVPSGKLLLGGRIPEDMFAVLTKKEVRVIDYFKSEAFQIENAYTTSEAALSIAMNNLKRNIRGASFAVTGYGRIARTLTELLLKLGARVCVLARKESDLVWARLAGAKIKHLDEDSVMSLRDGYDIIFNTVPCWLFFESFLSGLDKKTLIIDLASAPGGVDVSAAKKLSAKVLWASSLPGKYAPESAGEIIAACIKDIVSEENI